MTSHKLEGEFAQKQNHSWADKRLSPQIRGPKNKAVRNFSPNNWVTPNRGSTLLGIKSFVFKVKTKQTAQLVF